MAQPEGSRSSAAGVAALRRLRDDPQPAVARTARLALTMLTLTPDRGAVVDRTPDRPDRLTVPAQTVSDARSAVEGQVGQIDADPTRLFADQDPVFTSALVTAYLALVVKRAQPGWEAVFAVAVEISRVPRFRPDLAGLLVVYQSVLNATDDDCRGLVDHRERRVVGWEAGAWVTARGRDRAEWLRRTLAWVVVRAGLAALVSQLARELESPDPFRRFVAAWLIVDAAHFDAGDAVDDSAPQARHPPPPLPPPSRSWHACPMPPATTSSRRRGRSAGADSDIADDGDDLGHTGESGPPRAGVPGFALNDLLDVDRDVQFTVYKPLVVRPERWNQLLAFVHRSTPFVDDDGATVDPRSEVAAQAIRMLGAQREDFTSVVADSAAALPRGDQLVFEPWIEDGEVNPERVVLRWCEPIHRVEFRFRVSGQENGRRLRGAIRVSLGVLEVANVSFAVNVDRTAALTSPNPPVGARPYRRIFASYSHRDIAIVERVRASAAALGDRYMIDVEILRAGEQWQQRLAELIEEADVFQLFWSHNSMRSMFVRREWEHALALGRPEFVRPLFWEDPRPADPQRGLPPARLARLHFWRLEPALAGPVEIPSGEADPPPVIDSDPDPGWDMPPYPAGRPPNPHGGYGGPRRRIGGREGRYQSGRNQILVVVVVIVIVVLVLLLAHPR